MIVGKLIYLIVTRPDLPYVVSVVSQFMQDLRKPYWDAILRILNYLKKHPNRGIFYARNRDKSSTIIQAYVDFDWAGSSYDRRSTSGYCIYLRGNFVMWKARNNQLLLELQLKQKIELWLRERENLYGWK